jgi:hypothetical protein
MATTVTLKNTSAENGGACTCNDAHVNGPGGNSSKITIEAGKTANWDLSELGWDQYVGQYFEVAAICAGSSNWRHSVQNEYQLNHNYQFEWHGPSTNPSIVGGT